MRYPHRLRAASVLAATLAACQAFSPAQSKQSSQNTDLRDLRQQVQQLAAQQSEILKRLDDLKTLVKGPDAAPEIRVPNTLAVAGEPFRGQPGARVAIVEYGDFECPFCRRFEHDTYPQILDAYIKTGKIEYLHRDLPLPFHEHALPAAEAARCAGAQGQYWPMYDSLFSGEVPADEAEIDDRARKLGLDTAKLDACVAARQFATPIQQQVDEAGKLNVSGTPTFLIGTLGPRGEVLNVQRAVVGAQPFPVFQQAIDGLLAQAGAPSTAKGTR